MSRSQSEAASPAMATKSPNLGPALRRAWVGYQRRLDAAIGAAGFSQRQFPDGRVLRMCRANPSSISQIGRELGISRQGAHKIVTSLRARRYVTLRVSPANRSEKLVELTPRAHEYLAAHRKAVRSVTRQLRNQLGDDGFIALTALLEALGTEEQPRMREYLRTKALREA